MSPGRNTCTTYFLESSMNDNAPHVPCGENRGVSSVVGTVLMVGLVVVLAGTVTLTVVSLTDGRIAAAEQAFEWFRSKTFLGVLDVVDPLPV
jgi:flagellin-like protein